MVAADCIPYHVTPSIYNPNPDPHVSNSIFHRLIFCIYITEFFQNSGQTYWRARTHSKSYYLYLRLFTYRVTVGWLAERAGPGGTTRGTTTRGTRAGRARRWEIHITGKKTRFCRSRC